MASNRMVRSPSSIQAVVTTPLTATVMPAAMAGWLSTKARCSDRSSTMFVSVVPYELLQMDSVRPPVAWATAM